MSGPSSPCGFRFAPKRFVLVFCVTASESWQTQRISLCLERRQLTECWPKKGGIKTEALKTKWYVHSAVANNERATEIGRESNRMRREQDEVVEQSHPRTPRHPSSEPSISAELIPLGVASLPSPREYRRGTNHERFWVPFEEPGNPVPGSPVAQQPGNPCRLLTV